MSIRTETRGRTLALVIDRPEKKNAFTLAMYRDLIAKLDAAAADSTVRAVLIEGAGGCFTSGNDLADFLGHRPDGGPLPAQEFLHRLVDFPKPLVAAVDGPAVGIGTTLLLHCDLVFATASSKLKLPFTSLGLTPEGGSTRLLTALAGPQRAGELLLLGETFSTEHAAQMGLINEVLPNAEALAARVGERMTQLTQLPPSTMQAAKKLLRDPGRAELHAIIDAEVEVFVERLGSPEAHEAMTAFMAKRPPNFDRF